LGKSLTAKKSKYFKLKITLKKNKIINNLKLCGEYIDLQQPTEQQQQETVSYPGLPLAVYREISAHLEQIDGIKTEIIPQKSRSFDYQQSQVNGLLIQYEKKLDKFSQDCLEEILNYYAEKYALIFSKIETTKQN